jgi:hypothetical protein
MRARKPRKNAAPIGAVTRADTLAEGKEESGRKFAPDKNPAPAELTNSALIAAESRERPVNLPVPKVAGPLRWPRLLPEQEAAEYLGVTVTQFRAEVRCGIWPKPVPRGCRRNTYDRLALDRAVDRLSGRSDPDEDDLIKEARQWGKSG